VFGDCRVMPML